MKIRNIILTAAVTVGCAVGSYAQSARELIEQDVTRIGNQLHHYEVPEFVDTKAPCGYKAFYVSHFGRHGSRYHTSSSTFNSVIKSLDKMQEQGLLTLEGRQLRSSLDTLAQYHEGMGGILTQVGSLEHQGVATRLYERCPSVFRDKHRRDVLAVSSTVVRCNQSMMNFCTALKGKAPALDIHYYTNSRTDASLTRVEHGSRAPQYTGPDNSMAVVDSIKRARMDVTRFCGAMFTDRDAAAECVKDGDMQSFMYKVIDLGVIEQCLDEEDAPRLYRYFTMDELFDYWVARNAATLNAHGYSYENGEALRRCGKLELIDIIAKADEALSAGSTKAADFRFSHDGGVLPLIFFLGLEGNDTTWHLGEEWEHGWYGFRNIPMCTNVQMIFYRNRKGDVLVKFLHNERETAITALKPWRGPYYKWDELRPYLVSLTEVDCG